MRKYAVGRAKELPVGIERLLGAIESSELGAALQQQAIESLQHDRVAGCGVPDQAELLEPLPIEERLLSMLECFVPDLESVV